MTPKRAVNRRAARGAYRLNGGLGGTAATDSSKRLRMTKLFVPGPKCPHAQAASNDHCNPGNPHWHVDTCDLHRPLIQSPHSLNQRYHAEENTGNDDILTRHSRSIQYVTPNARFSGALPGASAVTGSWAAMPVQERIAPPA